MATAARRPARHPLLALLLAVPTLASRSGCWFVNTYRMQEARHKLADPRFGHYSLVGVVPESGLKSKSTFNCLFKKLLGQASSEVARPKS